MRLVSLTLAALAGLGPLAAGAAPPVVATDIAPIQSIAARVMQGVGTPGLVIPPGASPHDYALRPSEARLLQDAAVVVWVGPDLTPWLADPIDTLAPAATHLVLQEAPGVGLLPIRTGAFEPHAHGDGEGAEAGHDAEAHEHADADHDHDHDHDEDHAHGSHDGHLWLDPMNATAAARAIAATLAAADPANADAYTANAEAFARETDALVAELDARLAPVRGRPYIVFHDAFQYFEHAFDIPASGSIALQDGAAPGAARVADIRERLRSDGVVCAFAEPQFPPKLLATVTEGSDVRTGVLDGIGASLPEGPGLYPALLAGIADGLVDCLGDR